jgi:hypothetical protein
LLVVRLESPVVAMLPVDHVLGFGVMVVPVVAFLV